MRYLSLCCSIFCLTACNSIVTSPGRSAALPSSGHLKLKTRAVSPSDGGALPTCLFCATDADCGGGALCASDANGNSYCSTPCDSSSAACAPGFFCASFTAGDQGDTFTVQLCAPNGGSCQTNCGDGGVACGGACVDTTQSPNCGGCGVTCAANQSCVGGACTANPVLCSSCASDADCNGGRCVYDSSCTAYCAPACDPTAATSTCAAGFVCSTSVIAIGDGDGDETPPTCGDEDDGATITTGLCAPATNLCAFCPAGQLDCNGSCTDVSADLNNCGGCGNACPVPANATASCTAGVCGVSCNSGFTACNGGCVDLTGDVANCGGCGNVCPAAPANGIEACVSGACSAGCTGSLTLCSGSCTDTSQDSANCGACGTVCTAGQSCTQGVCQLPPVLCQSCQSNADCGSGGQCVYDSQCNAYCATACDPTAPISGCGSGFVCSASVVAVGDGDGDETPPTCGDEDDGATLTTGLCFPGTSLCSYCAAGTTDCGGSCVNTASDSSNCGACGTACAAAANGSAACANGACATTCNAGFTACGAACVDLTSDGANCGACGAVCPASQACSAGVCAPAVANCGGSCASDADCNGNRCVYDGACVAYCAPACSVGGAATCAPGFTCSAAVTAIGDGDGDETPPTCGDEDDGAVITTGLCFPVSTLCGQ